MNSRKELLKSYIKFAPRERRIDLEHFVDEKIADRDVERAIEYVEELDAGKKHHYITEMGYSDNGFYVKTETGMAFLS